MSNQPTQKSSDKKELFRVIKYTLVAASAGIIQFGTFALFTEVFGLTDWWLSYLPSLILSVLWNFTINRKYTFKSASNVPIAMVKVAVFYLIFTPLSTRLGRIRDRDSSDDTQLRTRISIPEILRIQRLYRFSRTIYQG